MTLPRVVIVLPVESSAVVYVLAESYEEQQRLALDLTQRDPLDDVLGALAELRESLGLAALDDEAAT